MDDRPRSQAHGKQSTPQAVATEEPLTGGNRARQVVRAGDTATGSTTWATWPGPGASSRRAGYRSPTKPGIYANCATVTAPPNQRTSWTRWCAGGHRGGERQRSHTHGWSLIAGFDGWPRWEGTTTYTSGPDDTGALAAYLVAHSPVPAPPGDRVTIL
ncbi:hypothetical protein GCM10022419_098430 [Nonomuraea rosea]|uniref:Uncharacterized protein n=1 Tax=Nonomuraea rosea TaxID=638574 RepID=A0ABP6Z7P2_9ACTN